MDAFRCRPDSSMYNVVIGLVCERGDLDMVMELMKEMESCNLRADMITFMSMFKGFCNVGRLEDACQLFKTMKLNGCAPNMVVYTTFLNGLCRVGSFEKALVLLGEMEKEGGDVPRMSLLIHQSSKTCVKTASRMRHCRFWSVWRVLSVVRIK